MSRNPNAIDHEYTDNIVCPWCGSEDTDSWEAADDGKRDCYDCGKPFEYEREVSCSYSTAKLEREE